MKTLNLGILAHIDAGKTSLTERLLYAVGVIDTIGSVDGGNTQTDTLVLERQRGITIKSAVVSFLLDDVTVNLIDTPGHPDFIAEVDRVLGVLDGAILVVSAVEGVQAQTRVLMRALQRLNIATLIFVNKIDRRGAQCDAVRAAIKSWLTPSMLDMVVPRDTGSKVANVAFLDDGDARAAMIERLSEHDEAVLADYIADDHALTPERLQRAVARQSQEAKLHPVFYGSAITGAGIGPLLAAIPKLLPARTADSDGLVSGVVFKIERGWAGDRIAYVRLFGGTLRLRDKVLVDGREAKVTAMQRFERGSSQVADAVFAGGIAKLWGLGDVRIGDMLGQSPPGRPVRHFAPPTLETQVLPRRANDRAALWLALTQLAEQDPLINLRQDDAEQRMFVSLYGEVQKEVIGETLLVDFGIAVDFAGSSIICVERPLQSAHAMQCLFKHPNPYLATVGLRIDPRPPGSGVSFALEVDPGQMPMAFYRGVEEAVRKTLQQGLSGWQVTDCHVAMVEAKHTAPRSTAADFRDLTPLVLAAALAQAGTAVCEPIQHFTLDLPATALGPVLPLLTRHGAALADSTLAGATVKLHGHIPAAQLHQVQRLLPGLTHGEGVMACVFDHYRPVNGPPPVRARSGDNPFDWQDYVRRRQSRLTENE